MAFLDKLGEVAKNMTEKAGDSLEINKLGGEINIEKGNIQCYQREIGEYYWAKFVTGAQLDPEAMLICDKIVVSQDRIRQLDTEIDQIKLDREQILAERAETKRIAKEEEERRAEEERLAREEARLAAEKAKLEEEKARLAAETPVPPGTVEVLEEAGKTDSRFCGNCGGSLKNGQTYCEFCGKAAE